jgi:protein-disulfide isomerase
MNRSAWRFSVALLVPVVLGLALLAPGREASEQARRQLDEDWWKRAEPFLRRLLNIPRSVELAVKDIQSAGTPEYRIVILEARQGEQTQPFLFYASADGTKIVVNQMYDLAQDPFGGNREKIRLEGAPSLGPADAPVTVVEYSDYTCPFCQRYFLTLEKPLLKNYGERVRFVYKHFPLVGLRAWSEDAAVAAACAFRQGNDAFWALHEQLFVYVERLKEKGALAELASKVPLKRKEFSTCLEGRESLADVQRDAMEAMSLGVQGTPTFFINGRPLHGLPSRERFFEILEEELALATAPKN